MRYRKLIFLVLVPVLTLTLSAADKPEVQKPGQIWWFTYNRYIAGDIVFRDVSGKKWPTVFWGPREGKIGGTLTYDPVQPRMSCFFVADRCNQTKGDPGLKVLGELIAPEKWPILTFTVNRLGEPAEAKGDDGKPPKAWAVDATLDIDGRKVPLKGTVTFHFWSNTGRYEARFLVKGSDLGLKGDGSTGEIELTVRSNFRDQEYEKGPDGHTRVKTPPATSAPKK